MRLSSLAWRGLIGRPLRTALTAGGVALGVAIVTATLIANQASTETVSRAAGELFGRAELRVRAFDEGGLTPRAVSNLAALPGVTASAPVAERQLTVSSQPEAGVVTSMLVIGVDPIAEQRVRSYDLVKGVFLSPGSPSDALVNAGWAADHGLQLGSQLLLTGHESNVSPLRIVGLLRDVR